MINTGDQIREKSEMLSQVLEIALLRTICFQILSCDLIYFYYYFGEKISRINEYEWCFFSLPYFQF